MKNFPLRARISAAMLHLCLSACVVGALLAVVTLFWYPHGLLAAVGALNVALTLVLVDVVLGPVLTGVVYDRRKGRLWIDLACVVCLQLVALAYGAAALFQGRPVFLAALGSRFEVVHADEVSERWLSESGVALPYFGPQWVGTRYPVDPVEVDRVELASSLGVSLGSFPQHHQPLAAMTAEILQGASPVATLQKVNPGKAALIRAWLVSHGRTEADTVFQGLKARSEDLTVMIDKKTGDVIGIAPFQPWE